MGREVFPSILAMGSYNRGASFATRACGSLLSSLALVGCTPGYQELPAYRYRLTVEVATPEGVRRGSSVIEVRTWQEGPRTIPSPGAIVRRLNGEAVMIDLGRRGRVFALLRIGNDMDWPGAVATTLLPSGQASTRSREQEIAAILSIRGKVAVPPTYLSGSTAFPNWPDLVTFANPSKPATISWLPPDGTEGGPMAGVVLRAVSIEIVSSAVTRRLAEYLPWLNEGTDRHPLPTLVQRGGQGPFNPPLTSFDFTRSADQ